MNGMNGFRTYRGQSLTHYTIMDVAIMSEITYNAMYAKIHRNQTTMPHFIVGNKMIIPKTKFWRWAFAEEKSGETKALLRNRAYREERALAIKNLFGGHIPC